LQESCQGGKNGKLARAKRRKRFERLGMQKAGARSKAATGF